LFFYRYRDLAITFLQICLLIDGPERDRMAFHCGNRRECDIIAATRAVMPESDIIIKDLCWQPEI